MKKFTLISLLTVLTFSVFAQGPYSIPYSNDFEGFDSSESFFTEWSHVSNEGVWDFDIAYFGEGYSNAPVFMASNSSNSDAWIFTPSFSLEAGTNYTLSFSYTSVVDNDLQKLKVLIGDDATVTAMTTEVVDLGEFTTTDSGVTFTVSSTDFSVSTSGVYHIGFYAYSDLTAFGALVVDNFSIDGETTNIEQEEGEMTINAYPNPNNGLFNVNVSLPTQTNIQLELLNVQGQVIDTYNADNVTVLNKEFDVTELSSGIYFLKVNAGNAIKIEKLVIK